jgi:hypothetical protein
MGSATLMRCNASLRLRCLPARWLQLALCCSWHAPGLLREQPREMDAGLHASRSYYSTTEKGAIKQKQQQASATRRKKSTRSVAPANAGAGSPSAAATVQPGAAAQVKPHQRRSTRAQKKSVKDLDHFDPSASSKGQTVKLPPLPPAGRSQSVMDEAPEARVGIAAPSPDRFRSQSVQPAVTRVDPRQTTMVWSPPHPTQFLDKRTDLHTMIANSALTFAATLRAHYAVVVRACVLVPETIVRVPCSRH